MDDHEIVAGLIAGRQEAAETFAQRFRQRVIWALRKQGIPDCDCEDVAQEVLLTGWRQLAAGRFQGRSELFSWLYTIILGKAADYRRRRGTAELVPLEGEGSPPTGIGACDADQEAQILANQALAQMPPQLRYVFVLRFRENVSPDAIAQIMEVSTKRVRNLISEAKRRFTDLVLNRGTQRPPRRLTGEKDD